MLYFPESSRLQQFDDSVLTDGRPRKRYRSYALSKPVRADIGSVMFEEPETRGMDLDGTNNIDPPTRAFQKETRS
jgi:hypothetical protein